MVSDSENSADEFSSKNSSGAKSASVSENSENVGNHDDKSRQHNGTCSDIDSLAAEKETTRRISTESSASGSESDDDRKSEKNTNVKNDARDKSKTNETEKEEEGNEKEDEGEEEEVSSEKQKSDAQSSTEEKSGESDAKCATPPPSIKLVPMSNLLNSAARKVVDKENEMKKKKSKNVSVVSISSDDSSDCLPLTSHRTHKKKLPSSVDISSESEYEGPSRSRRGSRRKASEKPRRPGRRAAVKPPVIDRSGESSSSDLDSSDEDITPKYEIRARKIKMPDCDLKRFQNVSVSLVQMDLPKLLEKHHLSEIRNHRQKIVVRRKSDGETVFYSIVLCL